jgi:hypothetical protein
MTVTPASFRVNFPEFTDATAYPDARITYWIGIAGLRLNACRWSTLLDHGTELFVAHNLVLGRQAAMSAAGGGVPGQASGPTSSETVDKVSVSYDTGAAAIEDGGAWNLTTYGVQFLQLARLIGAGGIQL